MMALNVDACFRVAQTVVRKSDDAAKVWENHQQLPRLRDLAVHVRTARFSRSLYNTSKGALITMTQALATRSGASTISTSTRCAPAIFRPSCRLAWPKARPGIIKVTPIGRVGGEP